MTLRTVLLSLQALLAAAEPDDPQDAVVAKQYKENPAIFQQTARHWTNVYAGGEDILGLSCVNFPSGKWLYSLIPCIDSGENAVLIS